MAFDRPSDRQVRRLRRPNAQARWRSPGRPGAFAFFFRATEPDNLTTFVSKPPLK